MSRISDEELRQAVSLASPGPWQAEPMTGRGAWIATSDGNWAGLSCGETDKLGEANAALIALAPALAAEVLQLREALTELADACSGLDIKRGDAALAAARAALSTPSPVVAKEDRDA